MKCYCFLDNVGRVDGEGESPWSRTHGKAFKGKLVPFGSKVYFRSTTDRVKKQKYEDLAIAGVFAGYETTPGYGWSGIYLIWRLEDSAGMDLKQNTHVIARRQLIPYIVRELEVAEGGIVYPLKAEYERVNNTLEGIVPGGYSQLLEWPADAGDLDVIAKPIETGDRWFEAEYYWYRLHVTQGQSFSHLLLSRMVLISIA